MDPNRKFWNGQQQALRQSLAHPEEHSKAIELFLRQHAMVHTAEMSGMERWSFEDEALEEVSLEQMRRMPGGCEHSLAWVIWHMTRIEDVTMNLLAAGSHQLLLEGGWSQRLETAARDTGNGMSAGDVAALGNCINLEILRAYRLAVGRRTREIVKALHPSDLREKVDPQRLRQVHLDGAVVPEAGDLLEYWGGLTLAGLLLMPPTRHNFVHWNEALKIKQKLTKERNENS